MFIADLKGKLTIHEEVSEDFLTSAVFSTFDLLPIIWLKEFLQTSINLNGSYLDFPEAESRFLFWERFRLPFGGSVEPDLIVLADNVAFIIEAKFYSGKSGIGFTEEEDTSFDQLKFQLADQIAREYFLGKDVLRGKTISTEGKLFNISDFFLILVTKDPAVPTKEIEESIDAVGKIEPAEKEMARSKIHWTNWQKTNLVIEEVIRSFPEESFERKISSQLRDFLHKRDLVLFSGFNFLDSFGIASNINALIFYRKKKRIYWSRKLFGKTLHFKGSNVFYVSKTKPYWEGFAECPESIDRVFYQMVERW